MPEIARQLRKLFDYASAYFLVQVAARSVFWRKGLLVLGVLPSILHEAVAWVGR